MSAPPGSMMRPSSLQAAAPRRKAALTITDRDGNVINLGGGKANEENKEGKDEANKKDGAVEEVTKGVSSLQVAARKDNSLLEAAKAAIGEFFFLFSPFVALLATHLDASAPTDPD